MLWWIPGQVAVGLRWFHWTDTRLWYLDGQDKDPVKPLGFVKYKEDLECLILGLSYSLQFSLYSHGLLPHHWLKIISVYHLPTTNTKPFPPFWERDNLFKKHLHLMKGLCLIFIFLHETNQYVYTITSPNCSRIYSPVHLIQHLHFL